MNHGEHGEHGAFQIFLRDLRDLRGFIPHIQLQFALVSAQHHYLIGKFFKTVIVADHE